MGRPPVLPSPRPPAPPRYRHNLRHPLHDIRGREVVDAGDTSLGTVAGQVLENPDQISKYVLERGLDAGTAFEILSIDIADVDVGRNIGAELQTDQAEAFRNGSIGVMDYYRMENVQADTGMRRSIAQPDSAE